VPVVHKTIYTSYIKRWRLKGGSRVIVVVEDHNITSLSCSSVEKTTDGKRRGAWQRGTLTWAGLRLLAERKREVGRRMGERRMGQREGERPGG
jgi:hypothetical protein